MHFCQILSHILNDKDNKPTFDSVEDPAVQGFPTRVTSRRTDTCPTAIG